MLLGLCFFFNAKLSVIVYPVINKKIPVVELFHVGALSLLRAKQF